MFLHTDTTSLISSATMFCCRIIIFTCTCFRYIAKERLKYVVLTNHICGMYGQKKSITVNVSLYFWAADPVYRSDMLCILHGSVHVF